MLWRSSAKHKGAVAPTSLRALHPRRRSFQRLGSLAHVQGPRLAPVALPTRQGVQFAPSHRQETLKEVPVPARASRQRHTIFSGWADSQKRLCDLRLESANRGRRANLRILAPPTQGANGAANRGVTLRICESERRPPSSFTAPRGCWASRRGAHAPPRTSAGRAWHCTHVGWPRGRWKCAELAARAEECWQACTFGGGVARGASCGARGGAVRVRGCR